MLDVNTIKPRSYAKCRIMTTFHDEIEIEDMDYDEDEEVYYYPCPCGDLFSIRYKVFCGVTWFPINLSLILINCLVYVCEQRQHLGQ